LNFEPSQAKQKKQKQKQKRRSNNNGRNKYNKLSQPAAFAFFSLQHSLLLAAFDSSLSLFSLSHSTTHLAPGGVSVTGDRGLRRKKA